jgi:chromosome segregation ATPase
MQQQLLLLQQLLKHDELQQLIQAQVEKAVQSRLGNMLEARLQPLVRAEQQATPVAAEAEATYAAMPACAAVACHDSQGEATCAHSLENAAAACPNSSSSDPASPAMPPKLQHAFEELQEKLTGLQASAAAGQAEVVHEALQHLHNRLVSIEEVIYLMNNQQSEHNKQLPVPVNGKEQQLEATLRHYMPASSSAGAHHTLQSAALEESAAVASACDDCPLGNMDVGEAKQTQQCQAAPYANLTCSSRSSSISMDAACAGAPFVLSGSDHDEAGVHSCSNPAIGAAASPSSAAAQAVNSTSCTGTAAMPIAEVSFDLIERQVAEIQQEVTTHQLQAMQEVTEHLSKQVQSLILRVEQQQSGLEVVLAALHPLEPQVGVLTGQVAALQAMATQYPQELQVVHQQIEQLSLQLSQVNASAADDKELDEVKAQLQQMDVQYAQLQADMARHCQQVQAAQLAAGTAATSPLADQVEHANATAEAGSAVEVTAAVDVRATAMVQELKLSVESQLACSNAAAAALQEQVHLLAANAAGQAADMVEASGRQKAATEALQQQIEEHLSKLMALEAAVTESREEQQADLLQKLEAMRLVVMDQIASLNQQLRQQVDTMAQILAENGSARSEQAERTDQLQHSLAAVTAAQQVLETDQACLKHSLTREVQDLIQQSNDTLSSTCATVRQQLSATAQHLSELDAAIQDCAKSAALAGVVATVRNLPGAIDSLSGRIDEVAQAQRAAEGQLNAGQEQQLVLQGQLLTLQSQLEVVAGSLVSQREELFADLQKLQVELFHPISLQLQVLRDQEDHLAQLQSQQAAMIEELGSGVEGWKTELTATLSRDRQQLAQVRLITRTSSTLGHHWAMNSSLLLSSWCSCHTHHDVQAVSL